MISISVFSNNYQVQFLNADNPGSGGHFGLISQSETSECDGENRSRIMLWPIMAQLSQSTTKLNAQEPSMQPEGVKGIKEEDNEKRQ